MANLAVQKVANKGDKPLPLFGEIEKRFDAVRRRAFELFEERGRSLGHQFEDWIKAEHEVMGWPAAEFSESDSKFELSMTLPGYEPKDVEVTATPTEIIVHAKTEQETKTEDKKRLWTEFQSNDVYRRFDLPQAIDVQNTIATLDKGMLHIKALKAKRAIELPVKVWAA